MNYPVTLTKGGLEIGKNTADDKNNKNSFYYAVCGPVNGYW